MQQASTSCNQFAAATSKWSTSSKVLQDAPSLRAKFGTGFHNVFGLRASANVQLDPADRVLLRSKLEALGQRQFRHWSSASLFGPVNTRALLSWYNKMQVHLLNLRGLRRFVESCFMLHPLVFSNIYAWNPMDIDRYSLQRRPEH